MPPITGVRGLSAPAAGGPPSWRLELYETLASTSDLCIARAAAGAPAGLAVLAAAQTDGRGSRGRRWIAPAGNLNLSVLLRPDLPLAETGLFALLAGLATAEALAGFLPPGVTPTLKWPNDVLLGGAKLAGVLIDAAPGVQHMDWLVIGIGANLTAAPDLPGRPATTLAGHGGAASAADAAAAVLGRLQFWLQSLAAEGAAPLRAAWLARAHPLGTAIEISAASGRQTGTFAGLSTRGELLLSQNDKIARIATGELLLGRGA